MIKVLEYGPKNILVCNECGSKIGFSVDDVEYDVDPNYIYCPVCHSHINLPEEKKEEIIKESSEVNIENILERANVTVDINPSIMTKIIYSGNSKAPLNEDERQTLIRMWINSSCGLNTSMRYVFKVAGSEEVLVYNSRGIKIL